MNALIVAESSVLIEESALVRRFLAWSPQALPGDRAQAVNALARAYLYCGLQPDIRAEAELALTRALDDPEPRVRRALSEAFASAAEAPRHVVLALASDIAEVSRAVLAMSPLLSEADLVDCAATGDASAQTAIARRARLGAPVAAALAEIGERAAALALIGNFRADLRGPALWRLFERFAGDAEMRARLIERPALPASLRAAIAAATTADVSLFASEWLDPRRAERIARDGREQAFVAIATSCGAYELAELVAWLRVSEHLTVGLLVRALSCGGVALFAQSLADMSGLPAPRAAGLMRDARGQAFASLYARAKMPPAFLPAFRIAVACAAEVSAGVGVDYALTMRMIRAIEAEGDAQLTPVAAMLWRLAGEGAREEAREFVAAATEVVPAARLDQAEFEAGAPHVLLLNVEPVNENLAPPVTLDLAPEPGAIAA